MNKKDPSVNTLTRSFLGEKESVEERERESQTHFYGVHPERIDCK